MNVNESFNESFNELDLLEILKLLIPEGTNQGCSDGNRSISVRNENGKITIECSYSTETEDNSDESFDDSDIKEIVAEFKNSLENLDDSIFLESLEKAKAAVDVKRFDELLNLEKYSEAEAIEIACLIDYFSQIISTTLQEKIQELVDLSEKF